MPATAVPPMRRITCLAALCGLALLGAAVQCRGAEILPGPGGIAVTDRQGRADDLVIGFPAPETVRVHDAAGELGVAQALLEGTGGLSCARTDARTAVCRPDDPAAGMRLDVRTGAGDDRVRFSRPSTSAGGVLAPRVVGGAGDDRITADGDLVGGPGDDAVRALASRTPAALFGGPGDDVLVGGLGPDVLIGGPGRDRLLDRSGANRFSGGAGVDLAVIGRSVRLSSASLEAGGAQVPPSPAADVILGDVEVVRS